MEFDEMKLIWDSQNNEPLYAINQQALNKRIQEKGKSVTRLLNRFDLIMIGGNLLVGIFLIVDVFKDNGAKYEFVLPILYIASFVYSFYRRYRRHQEMDEFGPTILGDLEKAIAQIDYLIKQSREMIWWYLLPILLVAFITLFLNAGLRWALGTILLAGTVAHFGSRWEINKWYAPKKRELESLRDLLLQTEEKTVA